MLSRCLKQSILIRSSVIKCFSKNWEDKNKLEKRTNLAEVKLKNEREHYMPSPTSFICTYSSTPFLNRAVERQSVLDKRVKLSDRFFLRMFSEGEK